MVKNLKINTTASSSKTIEYSQVETKPDMKLTITEIMELQDIQTRKEALRIIQESLVPTARVIAKEERRWWNGVLKARNITSDSIYKANLLTNEIEKL